MEWRFCDHLPGSNYFAQIVDIRTGTNHITSEQYAPDEVQVIDDDEGNPAGIALTRYSDNNCASQTVGD